MIHIIAFPYLILWTQQSGIPYNISAAPWHPCPPRTLLESYPIRLRNFWINPHWHMLQIQEVHHMLSLHKNLPE